MMVTGSLNDPRVNYWEPAKFVAKMRAVKTDSRMLVLKARSQPLTWLDPSRKTPCLPAIVHHVGACAAILWQQ